MVLERLGFRWRFFFLFPDAPIFFVQWKLWILLVFLRSPTIVFTRRKEER